MRRLHGGPTVLDPRRKQNVSFVGCRYYQHERSSRGQTRQGGRVRASNLLVRSAARIKFVFLPFSYALVATATDYDSWRENEDAVTSSDVFKVLQTNASISRLVTATVLDDLHEAAQQGDILTQEVGSMKFSIMPRSEKQNDQDRQKLAYILPGYFS